VSKFQRLALIHVLTGIALTFSACCGGSAKECRAAAELTYEVMAAEESPGEEAAEMKAGFIAAMTARCEHWPESARSCVAGIEDAGELYPCLAEVPVVRPTQEQCEESFDHLMAAEWLDEEQKEMAEAMKEHSITECVEKSSLEEIACAGSITGEFMAQFCSNAFAIRGISSHCPRNLDTMRDLAKAAVVDGGQVLDGARHPDGPSGQSREWGDPAGGWEALGWAPDGGKVRGTYELIDMGPGRFEIRCEVDPEGDGNPWQYMANQDYKPSLQNTDVLRSR
jgi:hypothetical protein